MRTTTPPSTSWVKTFFKPGWVFFVLFVIAFSYLAFTVLAPWQLGKDSDIVARNEQIEAAYAQDPLPYDQVLDANGAAQDGHEWSRVILRGHYLPDKEVLLRLRPAGSGPSYQSLVPFRTDAGDEFLINRGWIAAGPANAVPEIPPAPAQDIEITGMVREGEAVHDSAPITDQGYQQVYSINTDQVSQLTQTELGQDYIQLSEGQPGVLTAMPVPMMDRGNHLSYGFQWIAFGIMAPLGLGYFVWSEIRERRRADREEAEMAALSAAELSAEPSATAEPAPAKTAPTKTETSEIAPAEIAAGDSTPGEPSSEKALRTELGSDALAAAAPNTDAPADTAPAASAPAANAQVASAQAANTQATPRRHRARYGNAKPDYYSKFSKRNQERF